MRYSGIQPQYFPRLHYFARILATDIFVIRDDAQFVRKHKYPDARVDKSYQAHTPIKQSFGVQLLLVPTKHEGFAPITQTHITYDHNWVENHLKTLQIAYAKAPNFSKLYPEIEELLNSHYETLNELNITTILWGILHLIGRDKVSKDNLTIGYAVDKLRFQNQFRLGNIKKASETQAFKNFGKLSANEKIVALCKEFGASEDYCGGTGAAAYMDAEIFSENGIKITVQDWRCKEYPQLFTKQQGFLVNLSIIDLLMNASPKDAVKIILG